MAIKVLLVTLINFHREATVYFTLAVISGFLISCSCILGKFLNSRFVHIALMAPYCILSFFYAIFYTEIFYCPPPHPLFSTEMKEKKANEPTRAVVP